MTKLITNFTTKIEEYQKKSFHELLFDSPISPSKFKQIIVSEIENNKGLQNVFKKNPSSLFASILHCAELGLNPSQIVGEFYFSIDGDFVKPILGYKGLLTLLLRTNDITKIWTEIVFDKDDFEYELGLEPKMVHIPSSDSVKKSKHIKYAYACAKLSDGDVIFKVMSINEIKDINEIAKNELCFDDKKDPQHWMVKKIVLKQLSKTLPKDNTKLQKAISFDDNAEGGNHIIVDESDQITLIKGKVLAKSSFYANISKDLDIDEEIL